MKAVRSIFLSPHPTMSQLCQPTWWSWSIPQRPPGKEFHVAKSEHQKIVLSQFKPICFQFRFFDKQDLTCYNSNCLIHTLSLDFFFLLPAMCFSKMETLSTSGKGKTNVALLRTWVPFLGEISSS